MPDRTAQTVAPDECPNAAAHTPAPDAYAGWNAWAYRMSKTHRQEKCPACGLYAIWTPKGDRAQRQEDIDGSR